MAREINQLLSRELHWIIRYKSSECHEIEFTDTTQRSARGRRYVVKGVAHIILKLWQILYFVIDPLSIDTSIFVVAIYRQG